LLLLLLLLFLFFFFQKSSFLFRLVLLFLGFLLLLLLLLLDLLHFLYHLLMPSARDFLEDLTVLHVMFDEGVFRGEPTDLGLAIKLLLNEELPDLFFYGLPRTVRVQLVEVLNRLLLVHLRAVQELDQVYDVLAHGALLLLFFIIVSSRCSQADLYLALLL